MILTFDGEIEIKGNVNAEHMQELAGEANAGIVPGYYPEGTKAWAIEGSRIVLLATQYHDDDITAALDAIQTYLEEHDLTADGAVEYYGDYRGEYVFDNSAEFEENDVDDSDFENEWNCEDDEDDEDDDGESK